MASYEDVKKIQIEINAERKKSEDIIDDVTKMCKEISEELKEIEKEIVYLKTQYECLQCISILTGEQLEFMQDYDILNNKSSSIATSKQILHDKLTEKKKIAKAEKDKVEKLKNDFYLASNVIELKSKDRAKLSIDNTDIIIFQIDRYKFKSDGACSMCSEELHYFPDTNEWKKKNNNGYVNLKNDSTYEYIINKFLKDKL